MKNKIEMFMSRAPFYGEPLTLQQVLFWVAENYRASEFPKETLAEAHLYRYSEVPELCALWSPFGCKNLQQILSECEWEEIELDGSCTFPCPRNHTHKTFTEYGYPKSPTHKNLFEFLLTLSL